MSARKLPTTVRGLEDRLNALEYADGDWTAADVAEAEAIRAKLLAMKKRRNPPTTDGVRVATLHGMRGTLMAVGLDSLSYRHAQSRSHALYAHEFDGTEEMWAMADGSLVIRHPRRRLWADFIVSDSE